MQRLASDAELLAVVERGARRPGVAKLRAVLDFIDEPLFTRSEAGEAAPRAVQVVALPCPRMNARPAGRQVDACVGHAAAGGRGRRLRFPQPPGPVRARPPQRSEPMLAGYRVLRITWRRLTREPDADRRATGAAKSATARRADPAPGSTAAAGSAGRVRPTGHTHHPATPGSAAAGAAPSGAEVERLIGTGAGDRGLLRARSALLRSLAFSVRPSLRCRPQRARVFYPQNANGSPRPAFTPASTPVRRALEAVRPASRSPAQRFRPAPAGSRRPRRVRPR